MPPIPFMAGSLAGPALTPTATESAADTAEFFCAADLDGKPIPPRLWHVPDFVPAGTVTTLNGDGGTGKSLAALQRAVATALGRPWLGQDVKPPPFCIALSANAGGCRVVAQPRTKDLPPRPGCRGRTLPPWRSVPEAGQRAARGGIIGGIYRDKVP